MRVIITLLALAVVLGWLGFEVRERDKAVSNVLFGFSVLFTAALVAAFFGLL